MKSISNSCCCEANTCVSDMPQATTSSLTPAEKRARVWCRLNNRLRMNYTARPGLYTVGAPTAESPVFVSASYKLSFDILRSNLFGIACRILVLDTHGINVWCAAGKGTFGTAELVERVKACRLAEQVSHRQLIVPQLGAPGVRAHEVKKTTGFTVVYGPVRARDIPAFLNNGMKATGDMRRVMFPLVDRLVLTPMEMRPALLHFLPAVLLVLAVFGLAPEGILLRKVLAEGLPFAALGLVSIVCGSILTPVFLPWIPLRAFWCKGLLLGAAGTGVVLACWPHPLFSNVWALITAYMVFPVFSSYLALNFTGCTTFTGKSGVKRELTYAFWFYGVAAALALVALLGYKVTTWRLP